MTKLTLLNRDNNKMTGGGNVKQGLRPLATGFFGFSIWPKKKSSYSDVRFVGETPSPPGPFTTELMIEGEEKIGYSSGAGTLSHEHYKGVKITGIYFAPVSGNFFLEFETTPLPSFTKITASYPSDTPVVLQESDNTNIGDFYYEWNEGVAGNMNDFFLSHHSDTVTITIE